MPPTGTGFHGSQRTDDAVQTVEGVLWQAIGRAFTDADLRREWFEWIETHTRPLALTRSARTDKGVHALANVVALSMAQDGDHMAWAERVNLHLDGTQVKLLMRASMPTDFDARKCCDRRRYEYVLPYAALRASADESSLSIRRRLKRVLKQFAGSRNFRRFTRQSAEYVSLNDTWR